MSNTVYYQKLKDLVDNKRLSIYIIIAPPRTNSSLLEHSMGNSLDIHHECHEPFLQARHENFDPDHGYQQIYESIGGDKFDRSNDKTSVVVKEMSHWIGKNDEYKRLVELSTHPIVTCIRNPLLSVESRIRRVLTTVDMRYSIDTQRYLLDEVATEKGFPNWLDLTDAMRRGDFTKQLDFLQYGENIERLYNTPILTLQNTLLDLKATKNGYVNWRDLIEKKLYIEQDYAFFEGIFQSNSRRIGFESEEFKNLAEEVGYFEEQGRDYVVLDTTDLRAAPEKELRELCSRIGISFSPKMLEWGQEPIDFHTEQTQQSEKLWYDTLFASTKINPPTEISPTLSMFPKFMQDYLKDDNLFIYAHLSQKKILKNELKHELNEQEFDIKITDNNRQTLLKLRLIEDETTLGELISIKLKYIDPVYAVTNEPELIENSEFERFKDRYARELSIISEIVLKQNEHTRELNYQNIEKKFR
ncbi:MAG: hypothetical protein WC760_14005 [Bacteroidia bacterium]|jgi:hypothetical protein